MAGKQRGSLAGCCSHDSERGALSSIMVWDRVNALGWHLRTLKVESTRQATSAALHQV
jgi:hypothetical protein